MQLKVVCDPQVQREEEVVVEEEEDDDERLKKCLKRRSEC